MPQERSVVRHQKLGAALLVTVSLVTCVFGFVLVYKRIYDPLRLNPNAIVIKDQDQIDAERLAKLKTLDTDGDGLNDYDELYIYRTSPYLPDSDSDGTPDGVEIAQNTDPNCPKGTVCRQAPAPDASAKASASANVNGTPVSAQPATGQEAYDAILKTFGDPAKLTAAQIHAKLDAMSTADLHTFLKGMGVPDAAIAKNDDATLKKLLGDTLIEISNPSTTSAGTN